MLHAICIFLLKTRQQYFQYNTFDESVSKAARTKFIAENSTGALVNRLSPDNQLHMLAGASGQCNQHVQAEFFPFATHQVGYAGLPDT